MVTPKQSQSKLVQKDPVERKIAKQRAIMNDLLRSQSNRSTSAAIKSAIKTFTTEVHRVYIAEKVRAKLSTPKSNPQQNPVIIEEIRKVLIDQNNTLKKVQKKVSECNEEIAKDKYDVRKHLQNISRRKEIHKHVPKMRNEGPQGQQMQEQCEMQIMQRFPPKERPKGPKMGKWQKRPEPTSTD